LQQVADGSLRSGAAVPAVGLVHERPAQPLEDEHAPDQRQLEPQVPQDEPHVENREDEHADYPE